MPEIGPGNKVGEQAVECIEAARGGGVQELRRRGKHVHGRPPATLLLYMHAALTGCADTPRRHLKLELSIQPQKALQLLYVTA